MNKLYFIIFFLLLANYSDCQSSYIQSKFNHKGLNELENNRQSCNNCFNESECFITVGRASGDSNLCNDIVQVPLYNTSFCYAFASEGNNLFDTDSEVINWDGFDFLFYDFIEPIGREADCSTFKQTFANYQCHYHYKNYLNYINFIHEDYGLPRFENIYFNPYKENLTVQIYTFNTITIGLTDYLIVNLQAYDNGLNDIATDIHYIIQSGFNYYWKKYMPESLPRLDNPESRAVLFGTLDYTSMSYLWGSKVHDFNPQYDFKVLTHGENGNKVRTLKSSDIWEDVKDLPSNDKRKAQVWGTTLNQIKDRIPDGKRKADFLIYTALQNFYPDIKIIEAAEILFETAKSNSESNEPFITQSDLCAISSILLRMYGEDFKNFHDENHNICSQKNAPSILYRSDHQDENPSSEAKFSLAPIPTHNFVKITGASEEISKVEVLDIKGRKRQSKFEAESQKIDLSSLESGIFIVRIYNINSKVHCMRIVKI